VCPPCLKKIPGRDKMEQFPRNLQFRTSGYDCHKIYKIDKVL
jgi:hypothetical protein